MNKIITILEAEVSEKNWDTLQNAYRAIKENKLASLPLQSFLVQMKEDPRLWRIITVWENMEVLQKMKNSTETPPGVLVFHKAGTEPSLSIFEAKEEM